jgi:ABC-2 type transport system ATP-binding protein
MIEVKNLTKRYGSQTAVDNVSFTANEGEILGFLGPNGAGKSTTMNIITGYISATSGDVRIEGMDIVDNPVEAKRHIGYLPEHPPLYLDMTVDEYLNFVCDLKQNTLPRRSHLAEICELTRIADVRNRIIRNLSKGYRQRVGLAQALIGNPGTLILDEPTVGLDPKQILEIRTLIKNLGSNHTVILSSHILPEIQAVCDRIVIINKGHIVANDKTDALAANLSADHLIRLQVEAAERDVRRALEGIAGLRRIIALRSTDGVTEYEIEAQANTDIRKDVWKRLSGRQLPVLMMRSSELTLEEVFLKITTGDIYGNISNTENHSMADGADSKTETTETIETIETTETIEKTADENSEEEDA